MIYRSHFGFLVFLLSALLVASFVSDSIARPEFAAMEEKECSFCHLDPAGGGPRNAIGQVYEDNYFEFPEDFDPEAIMEEGGRGSPKTHNIDQHSYRLYQNRPMSISKDAQEPPVPHAIPPLIASF